MTKGKTAASYSPEVRERAVRMVLDHGENHAPQWAATGSIAAETGCTTEETLRRQVRQAERGQGPRSGLTTGERERMAVLEREDRGCGERTRS